MIYHVTTTEQWKDYEGKDHYAPSGFEKEGFIHACNLHQLEGVLHRYFSGQSDLLLLLIDERKLTCQLILEKSTGEELFPHLYGMLNKDAIVKIDPIG